MPTIKEILIIMSVFALIAALTAIYLALGNR